MEQVTNAQPTPERLMQFAFGYAPPLMINTAVTLRIFDLLDSGPRSADEISAATAAPLRGIRILMDGLTGIGMLAKNGRQYTLTPESATFLVSTRPGFHGGLFKHMVGQLMPKWMHLEEVVRTGKPAMTVNQVGPGSEFFEQFVESLIPMSFRAAQALAADLKLDEWVGSHASVLDLAAGSGVWGIVLAQSAPNVKVTAVDWPDVLKVTERIAGRFGVADRFQFSPGDLATADFGSAHRVATLGHILHSEGPERSRQLLRKTAAALAPGGTIAIAEFTPNEERTAPPHALIFGVNMLVNTDEGDVFTFSEVSEWLRDAGFKNMRQLEVPGPSPLILADKA